MLDNDPITDWQETRTGARLSDCRKYRYMLWRQWGDQFGPMVNFIGLNPSTADETEDDPTIRRCIGFAKRMGAASMVMTNLFALRATDPKDMKAAMDPVGPDNDPTLKRIAGCGQTIACWGVHGAFQFRGTLVVQMLRCHGLWCFGTTKAGHPKHPLYLKSDTELVRMSET